MAAFLGEPVRSGSNVAGRGGNEGLALEITPLRKREMCREKKERTILWQGKGGNFRIRERERTRGSGQSFLGGSCQPIRSSIVEIEEEEMGGGGRGGKKKVPVSSLHQVSEVFTGQGRGTVVEKKTKTKRGTGIREKKHNGDGSS